MCHRISALQNIVSEVLRSNINLIIHNNAINREPHDELVGEIFTALNFVVFLGDDSAFEDFTWVGSRSFTIMVAYSFFDMVQTCNSHNWLALERNCCTPGLSLVQNPDSGKHQICFSLSTRTNDFWLLDEFLQFSDVSMFCFKLVSRWDILTECGSVLSRSSTRESFLELNKQMRSLSLRALSGRICCCCCFCWG